MPAFASHCEAGAVLVLCFYGFIVILLGFCKHLTV
jgi:hypothetical protein